MYVYVYIYTHTHTNTHTHPHTLIVILLVVLYGCGTWPLTLRKEHRLRVFENRVLRKTLGPKRDEVKGVMRRLHNEELYTLYSSPNVVWLIKSRRMGMAGHVTRVGDRRGACRALLVRLEGNRAL